MRRAFVLLAFSLIAVPAGATTPHLKDRAFYGREVLSSSVRECDGRRGSCLEIELGLGVGSRDRAVHRIQRLAARRGLVVEVVGRGTDPRSRTRIRLSGDRGAVELLRRKVLRGARDR